MVNRSAREIAVMGDQRPCEPVPGDAEARRKVLIPEIAGGPSFSDTL